MSDYRQRYEDPEEALRTALDGRQTAMWTALPGIVDSFDATALTCTVQPAIKGKQTAKDGSVSYVNMPQCVDVPVFFPRGGGCVLTFPIAQGDECLLVFSSRCIDSWWQSGGVQQQAEFRMHDLSDGFALVGPYSQSTKISNVSTNSTQLRSSNGTTFFDLNPTAQTMAFTAPGGITMTAPTMTLNIPTTTAKGDVLATGNVVAGEGGSDRVTLQHHEHPTAALGGPSQPIPGT